MKRNKKKLSNLNYLKKSFNLTFDFLPIVHDLFLNPIHDIPHYETDWNEMKDANAKRAKRNYNSKQMRLHNVFKTGR